MWISYPQIINIYTRSVKVSNNIFLLFFYQRSAIILNSNSFGVEGGNLVNAEEIFKNTGENR